MSEPEKYIAALDSCQVKAFGSGVRLLTMSVDLPESVRKTLVECSNKHVLKCRAAVGGQDIQSDVIHLLEGQSMTAFRRTRFNRDF